MSVYLKKKNKKYKLRDRIGYIAVKVILRYAFRITIDTLHKGLTKLIITIWLIQPVFEPRSFKSGTLSLSRRRLYKVLGNLLEL
jgi:hypothetical protein